MRWGIFDNKGNRIGTIEPDENPIGCLVGFGILWIIGVLFYTFSALFPESERLTTNSRVSPDGIGPIKIGMTVKEAEKAGKINFSPVTGHKIKKHGCSIVKPFSWFHGNFHALTFMLTDGRISRIDVHSDNLYTKTVEGIGVPDSVDLLNWRYSNTRVTLDQANQTKYIEFTPPKAKNYHLIFESQGLLVDSYRAGKLPEVKYKNGCN
jgi:hypothetical protein